MPITPAKYFPITVLGCLLLICSLPRSLGASDSLAGPLVTGNAKVALHVVPFDDSGHRNRSAEFTTTLRALTKHRAGTVVFYVHGWRNEASEKNRRSGNLGSFEKTMLYLAESGKAYSRFGQDRVFGVYLAWDGVGGFGDRNLTAEEIGRGNITDTVRQLTRAARSGLAGARVLLVGHSLGGKVIEVATGGHDPNALFLDLSRRDIPDLTLIINSAADSKRRAEFLTQYKGSSSRPRIVSVTSKGDWLTRWMIPGGPSAGHSPDLCCHTLKPVKANDPRIPDAFRPEQVPRNPYHFNAGARRDFPVVKIGAQPAKYFELEATGNCNQTPYWVVTVPGRVLAGHSGHFQTSFIDFAAAMFRFAKLEP